MGEQGYSIKDQYSIHFITFAVIEWVDVFTRKGYADIVVESLKFCQREKGLKVHAWCIMSNHIHLILSTQEPNRLSDILRDFKKYTSTAIIKAINENTRESRKNWMLWIFKKAGEKNNRNQEYQFWRQDNHPIQCDTNAIIETRLNYVHENPVKAGIVMREQDYLYSSAIDYYTEEKGLIDIDFI
ncbi:transposase [Parapedobacter sp. SGR-10]|uniref:REP-associated tyrosine transposase n=1 Tax=Parapedobacter sp. SGR-10 TaxID=2710879 RepID=UPI0013D25D4D|nr:transposase [Parapedobacter sp. SGR-10]NGF57174.1 transposase [Parapedobacter sp. SGR-10]